MKKIIFAVILVLVIFNPNKSKAFGAEERNGPVWRISGDDIMYEKDGIIDETTEVLRHENYIALFLNGSPLKGAEGVILENRALVPLRAVGEGLGAVIGWDNESRKTTIEKDGKVFSFSEAAEGKELSDNSYRIIHGYAYTLADSLCFQLNAFYSYADPEKGQDKNSVTDRAPVIYIDEITEEKPLPKEEALVWAKKICLEGLGRFKKSPVLFNRNDMTYEEIVEEHQDEFRFIEECIQAMEFEGEFSRYYKFDMKVYKIIFDKYTGDMYYVIRNDAETVKKFQIDDPYLYIPLFFVG